MVGSHVNPHTGLYMHTQKDTNYYKLVQQLGGSTKQRCTKNKQVSKQTNIQMVEHMPIIPACGRQKQYLVQAGLHTA